MQVFPFNVVKLISHNSLKIMSSIIFLNVMMVFLLFFLFDYFFKDVLFPTWFHRNAGSVLKGNLSHDPGRFNWQSKRKTKKTTSLLIFLKNQLVKS